MESLNSKDFRKIKNIVETFVDNPIVIDNLFKSLVLFLNSRNTKPIETKEKIEFNYSQPKGISHRVNEELKAADAALNRFSDKLFKKIGKQRRKNNKITQ